MKTLERPVSYAAGVDLLDPAVPVEVKEAAIDEVIRNPREARKKNPPEYEAARKKAGLTGLVL